MLVRSAATERTTVLLARLLVASWAYKVGLGFVVTAQAQKLSFQVVRLLVSFDAVILSGLGRGGAPDARYNVQQDEYAGTMLTANKVCCRLSALEWVILVLAGAAADLVFVCGGGA